MPCCDATAASNRSKSRFVSPYGLTGASGASSVIGIVAGWPYTAHEDEKTKRRILAWTAASNSTRAAVTLLVTYFCGWATDSGTRAKAARWMIPSMRSRSRSDPTSSRFPTPLDEARPPCNRLPVPGAQVVQHHDLEAPLQELIYDDAADVPCTPGDENPSHSGGSIPKSRRTASSRPYPRPSSAAFFRVMVGSCRNLFRSA